MRKILIVVLDGVSDFLEPPDGARDSFLGTGVTTPLELANKPVLDEFTKRGRVGLMQPIPRAPWSGKYIAPQSDAAVLSLLGVDVYDESEYTGRGPVECFAEGLYLQDGDLMLRGNFATLGDGFQITDRRAGRKMDREEARQLCEAVNLHMSLLGLKAYVKPTKGHRCLAVIRSDDGSWLSGMVTAPDPAYVRSRGYYVGEAVDLPDDPPPAVALTFPMDDTPAARKAAALVNEFVIQSHVALKDHPANQRRVAAGISPANVVLVRDAGATVPKLEPVKRKYGVDMAVLAEMPVECGIARMTGMGVVDIDIEDRKKTEAEMAEDYRKFRVAVERDIKRHSGLYVHIKGPDLPGHDGDAKRKQRVIELIDEHFFAPLKSLIEGEGVVLGVTADHSTACVSKAHTGGPVPLAVWHEGLQPDAATSYNEIAAIAGSLAEDAAALLGDRLVEKGKLHGPDLLPLMVALAA